MISQETAARIWHCYREITVAETLLKDMAKAAKQNCDEANPETLRNAIGRRRKLQLGVPCSEDSRQLFDVEPELAQSVIRAHIASKGAELVEANEQARIELDI